ncbi:MAG: hypothetical protein JST73_06105 [Actinobacteria bacterium]|nr:hypothetical protein [Actinomycetota bacterium]
MNLRRILVAVALPCLIGIGFISMRAAKFDDPTALLAIGDNIATPAILHDLPHAYEFPGNGYDGTFYYVVARRPFDFDWSKHYLDGPGYRLRRILFPLSAKGLAPSGGLGVIYAFAALSILGVAIGGFALARFPAARPWLPLLMVINPGVIAAMWTSTSDALATGLALAGLAATFRHRFGLAVVLFALAGLTRETTLLTVIVLVAWPGLDIRRRVVYLVAPCLPVGLWSLYLAARLHESVFAQSSTGNFGLPFVGWIHAGTPGPELLMAGILAGTSLAATVRIARVGAPIAIFLAATLAMISCFLPVNAVSWWAFSRSFAVVFPVSIWALFVPLDACRKMMRLRTPARSAIAHDQGSIAPADSG